MYSLFLTKSVVKESKRRSKNFKSLIEKILKELVEDPYHFKAEKLRGELNFIYSYHFSFSGTQFRFCYTVNEKTKIITVVMVGPRENFYKILKKKLG